MSLESVKSPAIPLAIPLVPPARTARRVRRHRLGRTALVGIAFLALWFGFLELRGLYFPDEGRYAEIPREMLASGDWVTPRLNGFPYLEKPPLQYWITAAIFHVAGEDEWTARLGTAMAGLLALVAVMFTTRRLHSRRAGWMAAALMASCFGAFAGTQFVTLDTSLAAMLTFALCAFVLAQRPGATADDTRHWMLVAWVASALAVLTKGAIGVVIPAMAVVAYCASTWDWSLLRRLHIGWGIAVLIALVAPWFVAVEHQNPGFTAYFFIHEHWQRFTSPEHRRTGALWYYVPIAAIALMPWLPALVACARRRAGTPAVVTPGAFRTQRFLWCWVICIIAFFSLSASKLPAYILPALPALVLAMAPTLAQRWGASLRITAWTCIAGGLVLVVSALPVARLIRVEQVYEAYRDNQGWLILAGVGFVVTGAATLMSQRSGRPLRSLTMLVLGSIFSCQLAFVLGYRIDAYFSAEKLIERVAGGESNRPFQPGVPFYSVDVFDHTVPFYLGRTVILVKEKNELALGIAAAPGNYIAELETFADRWNAERQAFAIMRPETYQKLQAGSLPMRFLDTDGRRVVVTRH